MNSLFKLLIFNFFLKICVEVNAYRGKIIAKFVVLIFALSVKVVIPILH